MFNKILVLNYDNMYDLYLAQHESLSAAAQECHRTSTTIFLITSRELARKKESTGALMIRVLTHRYSVSSDIRDARNFETVKSYWNPIASALEDSDPGRSISYHPLNMEYT